ncbi:putative odorant receptor 92a [Copidosoma floridanum]|uniref:putative odorant receptor 92a n=1 Tax=Copidosoma floridanum TaxID=29053 RepID=UPI000C6F9ABB|nr:putative odorant receptor 92a [Copidosoma floridanum]
MDVLPLNFKVLQLSGLWYEENESFGFARKVYQLIGIATVYYLTFVLIAKVVLEKSNIDDITESLFLAMKYSTLCFKIFYFLFHRNNFYNVSSPEVLYFTICFNAITALYAIVIHTSLDAMSVGLFIVITGQLELNAHRIKKLSHGDVLGIKDCVIHNVLIRELTKKVESFVTGVVIPFFLFAMASICSGIFQASKYDIFSFDFTWIYVFVLNNLQHVFIYCWFGNQLMLTSQEISNAIYESNWILMNPRERKFLLISMISNKQGQSISRHGLCALNLNTFL